MIRTLQTCDCCGKSRENPDKRFKGWARILMFSPEGREVELDYCEACWAGIWAAIRALGKKKQEEKA